MKIMAISPHPDDETLGAGGSLLKLKALGNEIYWLNVTDIDTGGGGIVMPFWRNVESRLTGLENTLDFPIS